MDIFGILDISYDVLDESLTGLDRFQPNNPDFNLVQTFRLGTGFFLPSSGITLFFFVAIPSTWLFLMAGLSGELSDVCIKFSASFLTLPTWDLFLRKVEVL